MRLRSGLRRVALVATATVTVVAGGTTSVSAAGTTAWSQFGYDAAHTGANPTETTLSAGNVGGLTRVFTATLPGVADAPVVYRAGVATASGTRNLLFAHTRDGWTVALDAGSGARIWAKQVGPGSCRVNGSSTPCYTTSAAAVDPSGAYVYSYGLDGYVHKYAAGTGAESTGGGWPELATHKGFDEKGSSDLAVVTSHGTSYLYAANGGYPGDRGDYQGHVTAINLATGAQRVFNTVCSNQTVHFASRTSPGCGQVQSAVWARGGVAYDSATDRVYLTTGNGNFSPSGHNWGDTVLALHPDGSGSAGGPLDSYTPTNYQALQAADADLGSTAPAVVPAPAGSRVTTLGVQSGKDARLRLLNLANLSGRGGTGHTGGELQVMGVPQGGEVFTQPTTWTDRTGTSWVFVASYSGLSGLRVTQSGGAPRLTTAWVSHVSGTTPVIGNGVLYYLTDSGLRALNPSNGALLWAEPSSSVGLHWQSPIVVGGRVYYPDGAGHLRAYGLPAQGTRTGPIVGLAGKCLDDWHSGTAWGTRIDLYACNGTGAQRWTLPRDGTIRAFGRCLDVYHSQTADGTKVQLWGCDGSAAQRWTPEADGTIRALGRCLDVDHSQTANGTKVQLWACNGTAAQRWRLPA